MKLYRSYVLTTVCDGRLTVCRAEGESKIVDGVSMVRMGQGSIVNAGEWWASKKLADREAADQIMRTSDSLRQQAAELRGVPFVDRVHAAASRVVSVWREWSRGNPHCPQTLSIAVVSLINALPPEEHE